MKIRIVAAWPDRVLEQELELPAAATVESVRAHPELLPELAQAWQAAAQIGVFGVKIKAGQVLQAGDRIELWRPLQADPKEARRARATAKASAQRAEALKRRKSRPSV
jgi:uncharacterized protein